MLTVIMNHAFIKKTNTCHELKHKCMSVMKKVENQIIPCCT